MPTITRQPTDLQKAVEVLLYVTARMPVMYRALKAIYFADKQHLLKYGGLMYGEAYIAMEHGPVPSTAYDIVKVALPPCTCDDMTRARALFQHADRQLVPAREANLDYLSESDMECLDEAIAQIAALPNAELQRISHEDPAYKATDDNDAMTLEGIAESLGDPDLLAHLRDG